LNKKKDYFQDEIFVVSVQKCLTFLRKVGAKFEKVLI
jgi:hypothetical protein